MIARLCELLRNLRASLRNARSARRERVESLHATPELPAVHRKSARDKLRAPPLIAVVQIARSEGGQLAQTEASAASLRQDAISI